MSNTRHSKLLTEQAFQDAVTPLLLQAAAEGYEKGYEDGYEDGKGGQPYKFSKIVTPK